MNTKKMLPLFVLVPVVVVLGVALGAVSYTHLTLPTITRV